MLDRDSFADAAASLITRVESGDLVGYIGATTVTTIHYLASQALGRTRSRRHLEMLLDLFSIAPIDESILRSALSSRLNDYEDAVHHAPQSTSVPTASSPETSKTFADPS